MALFTRQRIDARRLPPNIKAKWPVHVLREGFVPFPKALLRTMARILQGENAIEQLAVLLAAVDTRMPAREFKPTLPYLAFLSGLSSSRCLKHLQELQKLGLVDVERDDMDRIEIDMQRLNETIAQEAEEEGKGT